MAGTVISSLAGADGGLRKGAGKEAVERQAESGQEAGKRWRKLGMSEKALWARSGSPCLWEQSCLVVTGSSAPAAMLWVQSDFPFPQLKRETVKPYRLLRGTDGI